MADYQAATHDVTNGSVLFPKSWDEMVDAYVYGSWNEAAEIANYSFQQLHEPLMVTVAQLENEVRNMQALDDSLSLDQLYAAPDLSISAWVIIDKKLYPCKQSDSSKETSKETSKQTSKKPVPDEAGPSEKGEYDHLNSDAAFKGQFQRFKERWDLADKEKPGSFLKIMDNRTKLEEVGKAYADRVKNKAFTLDKSIAPFLKVVTGASADKSMSKSVMKPFEELAAELRATYNVRKPRETEEPSPVTLPKAAGKRNATSFSIVVPGARVKKSKPFVADPPARPSARRASGQRDQLVPVDTEETEEDDVPLVDRAVSSGALQHYVKRSVFDSRMGEYNHRLKEVEEEQSKIRGKEAELQAGIDKMHESLVQPGEDPQIKVLQKENTEMATIMGGLGSMVSMLAANLPDGNEPALMSAKCVLRLIETQMETFGWTAAQKKMIEATVKLPSSDDKKA